MIEMIEFAAFAISSLDSDFVKLFISLATCSAIGDDHRQSEAGKQQKFPTVNQHAAGVVRRAPQGSALPHGLGSAATDSGSLEAETKGAPALLATKRDGRPEVRDAQQTG